MSEPEQASETERAASPTRICVARIGAPHGVRGEVHLFVFTEAPDDLAALSPFESEDGTRHFALESFRRQGAGFVARLSGVADRASAEALRNAELYAPRSRLPALAEDDTFYRADLIGLAVVAPDGTVAGRVIGVENFGAGDILDIAPAAGGASVLLPFASAFVPAVDLAAGRLTIASADLLAPAPERRPRSPS